jgi:hypothetical protein
MIACYLQSHCTISYGAKFDQPQLSTWTFSKDTLAALTQGAESRGQHYFTACIFARHGTAAVSPEILLTLLPRLISAATRGGSHKRTIFPHLLGLAFIASWGPSGVLHTKHTVRAMTRINVVPVEDLTDQHLMAEYRELPMVLAAARRSKIEGYEVSHAYTLNKGHVKFFYSKKRWLTSR